MSDDRNNKAVSREFLAERDLRIFKMRQAGVSTTEIARRFGITSSVVNRAVQRQLSKLNSEALLAYPEVLRMELERLDNLQQAIWPMTQHRLGNMDDGTEVAVVPDLKAIQQVLSIMDRRSKLLGMEQNTVNVNMDIRDMNPIKATLAGEASTARALSEFDAEGEARQLLEIMGASGVLPSDTVRAILGQGEIVDAEVVETEQDE